MSGVSAPKENPAAFSWQLRCSPEVQDDGAQKLRNKGMGLFALKYARCIFAHDLYVNKR